MNGLSDWREDETGWGNSLTREGYLELVSGKENNYSKNLDLDDWIWKLRITCGFEITAR